jgi:hypothetical protein
VKKRTISVMVGTALASVALAASASAAPSNGVGTSRSYQPASSVMPIPGDVNFDNISAPCAFAATVPLTKLDGVKFKGTGAVLNQCGNFNVSGFSAPNFLAFNDIAHNADGTVPTLPEKIILPGTFSGVSLNVASGLSVGRVLKIKGKNATGGSQTLFVTLTPGVQNVSFSIPVKNIQVSSANAGAPADILIIDDIVY